MKRLLVVALLVAGCGGAPATPSVPATAAPTPTPTATAAPTAAPTITPAQAAAKHVTASVTELMNLVGNDAIEAWIGAESAWLDTQPNLPILRPYLVAITGALIEVAFKTEDTNLAIAALEVIAAAREVPGVALP